jgi:hypothetical protein
LTSFVPAYEPVGAGAAAGKDHGLVVEVRQPSLQGRQEPDLVGDAPADADAAATVVDVTGEQPEEVFGPGPFVGRHDLDPGKGDPRHLLLHTRTLASYPCVVDRHAGVLHGALLFLLSLRSV